MAIYKYIILVGRLNLINTFLSPICIYRQGSLKKHYRSPGNTVHGAHTYITTHRNKNVNFDKIKYTCTCIFIVLVPLTKSVLKTAVHNIHKLAWVPYARGPLFNCPACPCVKTALITQG